MKASKLWWLRIRLVAAFTLLVAASFLIALSHFFDMVLFSAKYVNKESREGHDRS